MPRWQVGSRRQVRCAVGIDEEPLHISIAPEIEGDGVVDVVRRLLPGIGDDFLPGMIRVQRRDDALERIVEQDGADTDLNTELESVAFLRELAEKRLVLADGFSLVVEDGPAAAYPAQVDVWPAFDQRPRLGLELFLDLAPKAVGVGKADLDIGGLRWLRIT